MYISRSISLFIYDIIFTFPKGDGSDYDVDDNENVCRRYSNLNLLKIIHASKEAQK